MTWLSLLCACPQKRLHQKIYLFVTQKIWQKHWMIPSVEITFVWLFFVETCRKAGWFWLIWDICIRKIWKKIWPTVHHSFSYLICTLISENEGLEKLRSASNLRKISVPAHLNFFSVCHLNFFLIYTIDLKKIQVTNWKKIQVFRNWNFSKVWSRPWFL